MSLNSITLDFASPIERSVWLSSSGNHPWNPNQETPATAWEAGIDRLMRAQASAADRRKRKAAFDKVQDIVSTEAPLLYLVNRHSLAGESWLRRYPGELSVGQAQRALIAMAVLHRPALLIADEPTSALDAVAPREIMQLFRHLNQQLDMGLLHISHDLLSVASFCHRVAILHDGEIVEFDETYRVFDLPSHPYTRRLIAALNPSRDRQGAEVFPSRDAGTGYIRRQGADLQGDHTCHAYC